MAVSSLLKLGAKLRRGQVSQDARQMFLVGGREADAFYGNVSAMTKWCARRTG